MLEEHKFKQDYVRTFIAAYKDAVQHPHDYGHIPSFRELLETAKTNADRAWREYLEKYGERKD